MFDYRYQVSVRITAGVCTVQPLNISENNQQIRTAQAGYNSRKCVIVAKSLYLFDFINGNGVIFIDNRDNTGFQQCIKGIADIFPLMIV